MILEEIVKAINKLDDKVNAICEAVKPMQDTVQTALANCAFDKDLISYLMQEASRDLNNLEATAFAKYVDGMSALASKRGNKQAADFRDAVRKLEKAVPDSFLANIEAKNAEIMAWQKHLDKKMAESREQMLKMRAQIKEFDDYAERYDTEVRRAATSASLAMQKSQKEIRDAVKDHISENLKATKEMAENFASDCSFAVQSAKKDLTESLIQAQRELEDEVSAMVSKREQLEALARKAGENIIETSIAIAEISNKLPRSERNKRGRRDN